MTWWEFVQYLNGMPGAAAQRVLLAMVVHTSGHRDQTVDVAEVAGAVDRTAGTVGQALSRLKADGWLYQSPAIGASGRPVLRYRTAKEISG